MWHVIGDPTLEIWTENPNPNLLPEDFALEQGDNSAMLTSAINGAIFTAYQVDPSSNEFVVVGRATVVDGQAKIEYLQGPVSDAQVILSISAENAVSRR